MDKTGQKMDLCQFFIFLVLDLRFQFYSQLMPGGTTLLLFPIHVNFPRNFLVFQLVQHSLDYDFHDYLNFHRSIRVTLDAIKNENKQKNQQWKVLFDSILIVIQLNLIYNDYFVHSHHFFELALQLSVLSKFYHLLYYFCLYFRLGH